MFTYKLTQLHLKNLEKYLVAASPYLDIISFGADLAMQTPLLNSLQMYREFFKPHLARLWQRVK